MAVVEDKNMEQKSYGEGKDFLCCHETKIQTL